MAGEGAPETKSLVGALGGACMDRRLALRTVAGGLCAALAGCSGSPPDDAEQSPAGTDGAAGATRGDGATATPTTAVDRATATGTVAPTTTPPSDGDDRGATDPSPTPTGSSGRALEVTDAYWDGLSHITAYGADGVTAVVRRDSKTREYDRARLAVGALSYREQRTFASTVSEEFSTSEAPLEFDLSVDLSDAPAGRLAYALALLPPEGSDGPSTLLMMTDPFRRTGGGVERAPHPAELGDATEPGFAREAVEGQYNLALSGTTEGNDWTIELTVRKTAFAARVDRDPAGTYDEYASFELDGGDAGYVAGVLESVAHDEGFTGASERVAFALDLVQGLPHVTDDVSAGHDGDLRYAVEALATGRGDCQDTAALLAVLLEAPAFGEDAAVVEVRDHVAAGVAGDYSGAYYPTSDGTDYYYAETTGEDWAVGEIPDEYRGEDATLYDV